RATATGFVYLTDAQINDFQQYVQGNDYVLPPEVVQTQILPTIFGGGENGDGTSTDFLMDHPQVRLCMREIKGDPSCASHTDGMNGTPEPEPPPAPPDVDPPPAQPADIAECIARQMQHAEPPEGIVNFGVDSL